MYALCKFTACYCLVGTCTYVCIAFQILVEVIEQFTTPSFLA